MILRAAAIVFGLAAFAAQTSAFAGTVVTDGQNARSSFMRVYGPVAPPAGYVGFCDINSSECGTDNLRSARFDLTEIRMLELQEINFHVNHVIAPQTDADLYGTLEHWAYPSTSGDCEDYALLKRRMLMSRGWPASALLLTVVRDENGDGHAILTVRTRQGDFMLDNRRDRITRWNDIPYEFIKRQSYLNPRIWVALNPTVMKHSHRTPFVLVD